MSLPITFHHAASAEFIEASAWYEGKRLGLGLEFIAEIDRCLSLASKNPLQFAVVREDIRRVVANRFPISPVAGMWSIFCCWAVINLPRNVMSSEPRKWRALCPRSDHD